MEISNWSYYFKIILEKFSFLSDLLKIMAYDFRRIWKPLTQSNKWRSKDIGIKLSNTIIDQIHSTVLIKFNIRNHDRDSSSKFTAKAILNLSFVASNRKGFENISQFHFLLLLWHIWRNFIICFLVLLQKKIHFSNISE